MLSSFCFFRTSQHPIDDLEGELVGDVEWLPAFLRGKQLRVAHAPAGIKDAGEKAKMRLAYAREGIKDAG